MDTDTLVDNRLADGWKVVEELPQRGFEVTAAFWLQASVNGKWYFYVVSPLVETEGIAAAYGKLQPIIRAMPQPLWIDPLEINLIGPSNPIARDARAAHDRVVGPRAYPMRWNGKVLGNVSVEGAYLYPLPAAQPH